MLTVCNHCHRHYRDSETHCPFCRTTRPEANHRLGLGLAVAMSVAATLGCSGVTDNGTAANTGGAVSTGGMGLNAYGAPPMGGASSTGGNSSTSNGGSGGGMVTAYAGPPAGGAPATGGANYGTMVAAYAPPPAPPVNMPTPSRE